MNTAPTKIIHLGVENILNLNALVNYDTNLIGCNGKLFIKTNQDGIHTKNLPFVVIKL